MAKNILVLFVSLILSFLLLEGFSRLVFPIQYGHKYFALNGQTPVSIYAEPSILKANFKYRQLTQEFDALTTHNVFGTRGTDAPDNPDIIFIGDSMVYGIGLADTHAIPHQICEILKQNCINLGLPGSSTIEQLDRLEHYLKSQDWKPKQVILIANVMTSAFMGGNDLADNLRYMQTQKAISGNSELEVRPPQKSVTQSILDKRYVILEHLNIARVTLYVIGPMLRDMLTPELKEEELESALVVMSEQFQKLDNLADTKGFKHHIFLVHPMQDIMRGTWSKTEADLQKIVPHTQIISSAPSFSNMKRVSDYYYPLDGHVTPQGAQKISEFIADRLRAEPQ